MVAVHEKHVTGIEVPDVIPYCGSVFVHGYLPQKNDAGKLLYQRVAWLELNGAGYCVEQDGCGMCDGNHQIQLQGGSESTA